jgi:hypothetical protein
VRIRSGLTVGGVSFSFGGVREIFTFQEGENPRVRRSESENASRVFDLHGGVKEEESWVAEFGGLGFACGVVIVIDRRRVAYNI